MVGSIVRRPALLAFVLVTLRAGAALSADPDCPVLILNGAGRYAQTSATVYPNSTTLASFTAEAWIYPGLIPFDHNTQVIVTDDAYDLLLDYAPAQSLVRLVVRMYGLSSTVSYFDTRFVNLNQWHHVSASFDAGQGQLYITLDGNVGSPRTVTLTNFATYSSHFLVGSYPSSGYFNGYVDEVRVSNVARYNANFTPATLLATDANTRALYHFNQHPTATAFLDSSGNGNTLNAVSGASTGTPSCTLAAAPTVNSIAPTSGSTSGGTPITISGTNFLGGVIVKLGGATATGVVVSSSTTITATTAARSAGTVDVLVTNPDEQFAVLFSGYTYAVPPAPSVSSVSPPSGTSAGGTPVTIAGANFIAGATVTIGGVAATSVVVGTPSTISAKTGAHAAGLVSVVVTNPDAQSGTGTNLYAYYTASFTDDPLTAGVSPVRAVHVSEMRTRIDALRSGRTLPPYPWVDSPLTGGMLIRAVHVTDLREALRQVYVAALRPVPSYTDPALAAGAVAKVVHVAEIRSAIAAIE